MDLIILNDGLYQLIPLSKQMMDGIVLTSDVDCFDLCEIIRENFTTYISNKNIHIINGSKDLFYGCICGAEAPQ